MEKATTPSMMFPMHVPMLMAVPELLKKDNYKKWSVFMRHYFVAQDLWDVVEEGMPADGNTMLGDGEKERKKKNALAVHAIKISCGEEMYNEIKEVDVAGEAWRKLAYKADNKQNSFFVKPVETEPFLGEPEEEWTRKFLNIISEGDYLRINDDFFKKHPTANAPTALHIALTSCHSGFFYGIICENLLRKIWKLDDLMMKDKRGSTLLSNAVQTGRMDMVISLIRENNNLRAQGHKSNKDNSLIYGLDANGKLPVQLACERGHERITRYLYIETPSDLLHPAESQNFGLYLFKECITKKMFDIALHLLYNIPKLDRRHLLCHSLELDPRPIILYCPRVFFSIQTLSNNTPRLQFGNS